MSSDVLARGVREDRLRYAERLMAKVLDRKVVEKSLQDRYGITARHARRYTRAVRRKWQAESSPEKREEQRAAIRAGYLAVLQDAWKEGDRASSLKALRALAELEGVNAPQQHVVTPQMQRPLPQDKDADDAAEHRLMLVAGGKDE